MGSIYEFSMAELAEKIITLTGSSSTIVCRLLLEDDPVQRRPNLTLAGERLGWEPTVDLEVGLERRIEYFRELLGA